MAKKHKVKTHDRGMSGVFEFTTKEERAQFLRSRGLFESGGIWKNLHGDVIGIFEEATPKNVVDACHREAKRKKPVLDALVGVKRG